MPVSVVAVSLLSLRLDSRYLYVSYCMTTRIMGLFLFCILRAGIPLLTGTYLTCSFNSSLNVTEDISWCRFWGQMIAQHEFCSKKVCWFQVHLPCHIISAENCFIIKVLESIEAVGTKKLTWPKQAACCCMAEVLCWQSPTVYRGSQRPEPDGFCLGSCSPRRKFSLADLLLHSVLVIVT